MADTVPITLPDKASKEAFQQADAWQADAALAAAEGRTPGHLAARQRVARQFVEIHLPDKTAQEVHGILAGIDWSEPVVVVNGAVQAEERKSFWRKPKTSQLLFGERFKPRNSDDPIYALKSYPVK